MNLDKFKKRIAEIKNLKSKRKMRDLNLSDLQELPIINGALEFKFRNYSFFMLNINNDDGVVLRYLWRDQYERLSLNLWYYLTRNTGYSFDIGAHTGIYSVVGNLGKKENQIISIEPFFLNYSRLLSNLKLNNISTRNCFLTALSNSEGLDKMKINSDNYYHTAGNKISNEGNLGIEKKKLDNFKLDYKVMALKIDTEGHEYEVLEGGLKTIEINAPEIIFEINEKNFNKSIGLLKKFKYNFYFINEDKNTLSLIDGFDLSLIKPEGSNCLATQMQYKDLLSKII